MLSALESGKLTLLLYFGKHLTLKFLTFCTTFLTQHGEQVKRTAQTATILEAVRYGINSDFNGSRAILTAMSL